MTFPHDVKNSRISQLPIVDGDRSGARPFHFADFHLTNIDVFYTETDQELTSPRDFKRKFYGDHLGIRLRHQVLVRTVSAAGAVEMMTP